MNTPATIDILDILVKATADARPAALTVLADAYRQKRLNPLYVAGVTQYLIAIWAEHDEEALYESDHRQARYCYLLDAGCNEPDSDASEELRAEFFALGRQLDKESRERRQALFESYGCRALFDFDATPQGSVIVGAWRTLPAFNINEKWPDAHAEAVREVLEACYPFKNHELKAA